MSLLLGPSVKWVNRHDAAKGIHAGVHTLSGNRQVSRDSASCHADPVAQLLLKVSISSREIFSLSETVTKR